MLSFREGETIIGTYYHHKFLLFVELAPMVLFACIVAPLAFFVASLIPSEFAPLIPAFALCVTALLHVFWIVMFVILVDFSLDFWVLTNGRVIAVEQKGLFSQTVGEFELSKIQDVMVEISGIIATMFNYGTIKVSTAGEHQDFEFRYVYDPNAVRDAILRVSAANKP